MNVKEKACFVSHAWNQTFHFFTVSVLGVKCEMKHIILQMFRLSEIHPPFLQVDTLQFLLLFPTEVDVRAQQDFHYWPHIS